MTGQKLGSTNFPRAPARQAPMANATTSMAHWFPAPRLALCCCRTAILNRLEATAGKKTLVSSQRIAKKSRLRPAKVEQRAQQSLPSSRSAAAVQYPKAPDLLGREPSPSDRPGRTSGEIASNDIGAIVVLTARKAARSTKTIFIAFTAPP